MKKVLGMNKLYLDRLFPLKKTIPFVDKDIIKVIIGQRRVGKSTFLLQIMDWIKKEDKKAHIIFINKELHEFDAIKTHVDLINFVKTQAKRGHKNYVFVDEVQDIEEFEKALRSLLAEGKHDIFCSGSNAHLLSGELATYLSGRFVEIKVHSLSYQEFLTFHQLENNNESLLKYIKYGGLPFLKFVGLDDSISYDYLRNVYSTILLKDVTQRFAIRNIAFLESLVAFLADNIGFIVSAKKISDFLISQRMKISPNVVLNYLSYLAQAYFIDRVPRFDIRGKKIFEIHEKCYFEDLGLRHAITGYKQTEVSGVLENLIYHHLVVLGYKISVGQLGVKEIDFVCERGGERFYVQVAYSINEHSRDREFGNLMAIQDNFPKYVVSMDELIGSASYQGITHLHVRDFLMRTKF